MKITNLTKDHFYDAAVSLLYELLRIKNYQVVIRAFPNVNCGVKKI